LLRKQREPRIYPRYPGEDTSPYREYGGGYRRKMQILQVRYALWNVSGWHRDYSPPAWRNRATEEQKREGWEMAVRIERNPLHQAHGWQVEEVMDTLQEGPEGLYMEASLLISKHRFTPGTPGGNNQCTP
jgi:hypothetical protein